MPQFKKMINDSYTFFQKLFIRK